MWIFHYWPIFECVSFFLLWSLEGYFLQQNPRSSVFRKSGLKTDKFRQLCDEETNWNSISEKVIIHSFKILLIEILKESSK